MFMKTFKSLCLCKKMVRTVRERHHHMGDNSDAPKGGGVPTEKNVQICVKNGDCPLVCKIFI